MAEGVSSGSNTRVLAGMAHLVEQLIVQSRQENGHRVKGLVERILRSDLGVNVQRSLRVQLIRL
ncbi:hypothetical protein F511_38301 [Dorcoceras hygrometricum]|uniref:Uncharacterized protein n=1 Tax=Dorcoceras hygrometricum TaxID=472368 RepID=A0A2Z7C769_9LAMI|nr:hypothetical protein F511_38301 [Dorcoceras hygrometricum]